MPGGSRHGRYNYRFGGKLQTPPADGVDPRGAARKLDESLTHANAHLPCPLTSIL